MLPGIWVGRQLTSSWLSVSAVAVADYLSLGSKSPWPVKTKMYLAHNYLPLAYIFQQTDCYEQNQQWNKKQLQENQQYNSSHDYTYF